MVVYLLLLCLGLVSSYHLAAPSTPAELKVRLAAQQRRTHTDHQLHRTQPLPSHKSSSVVKRAAESPAAPLSASLVIQSIDADTNHERHALATTTTKFKELNDRIRRLASLKL